METPSAQARAFLTNALLQQIKALWPEGSVSLNVHSLPVDLVRDGVNPREMTIETTGEDFVTSNMHGIQLYS